MDNSRLKILLNKTSKGNIKVVVIRKNQLKSIKITTTPLFIALFVGKNRLKGHWLGLLCQLVDGKPQAYLIDSFGHSLNKYSIKNPPFKVIDRVHHSLQHSNASTCGIWVWYFFNELVKGRTFKHIISGFGRDTKRNESKIMKAYNTFLEQEEPYKGRSFRPILQCTCKRLFR